MSVTIYAAENSGTLAVDCRDVITIDDARYILERCKAAVRSNPVYFLIDCSDLITLAPGVLGILAGYNDFFQHPNTRWLAFVTRSRLLQLSIQVLFGHTELRFFEDRASADQFLHSVAE